MVRARKSSLRVRMCVVKEKVRFCAMTSLYILDYYEKNRHINISPTRPPHLVIVSWLKGYPTRGIALLLSVPHVGLP